MPLIRVVRVEVITALELHDLAVGHFLEKLTESFARVLILCSVDV